MAILRMPELKKESFQIFCLLPLYYDKGRGGRSFRSLGGFVS